MTFEGKVTISGAKIGQPTMRFVFHQKDLKIHSADITFHDKKSEKKVEVARINTHKRYEEVRIHSDDMLRPGKYTIQIKFSGIITPVMNGVYPCFFEDNGEKKEIIATQFESHHAREVFPCIDEPEAKATFELILTTPAGEEVISNTPIIRQSKNNGKVISSFDRTPKMSTYLLAFIYGDMRYKEAKTKDGVIVRAYATPDKIDFVDFALDVAVKCLDFYNDYYGIDYPLKKCDFVALPDFASGAMENWGCITFREQTLLVDPNNTSLANKQYVALVVAHELAHQWFGNLVTMGWWTDLWLNEGFASWMEYLVIDHLFPEWNLWIQFAVDEKNQALILDALENTHPVEVPVRHPDEIRTIFDSISYSKGASLINMLYNYIGAQDFRNGLRYYLEKHSYSNTNTNDLWEALEDVSKKPVKNFMEIWTSKPGFPIVECDVNAREVSLKQSRFFLNPKNRTKDPTIWPVPVLTRLENMPAIFEQQSENIKLTSTTNLLLNQGQSGFYRVTYNATHLEHLGNLILRGHISPTDRLGLLSDVFESSRAGKSDTAEALHFLSFYKHEDNYAVWDIIASLIGNVRLVMDDEELRENMKPYVRNLVKEQLERLGIKKNNADTHFDRLLRPIIIGMAAGADEKHIVDYCLKTFDKIAKVKDVESHFKSTGKPKAIKRAFLDPDLRGTIFSTIARLGGKSEFDKLVKLHNETTMSEEKNSLSAAITNFQQPELIKKSLTMIKSKHVRPQDISYWLAYSFMNRHSKRLTWDWLKDEWEWLERTLGTDLAFYRTPIYVARAFSDEEFLNEFMKFFKPRITPALDRSYKQAIEVLEYQSAWKKRALDEVKVFFKTVQ